MPVEAGSADGHRSGAIKLLVCGICDSSQIHRIIVSAVVVIKKTVSDVQKYTSGVPLGYLFVWVSFGRQDYSIVRPSNSKEKGRAKLLCLKGTLNPDFAVEGESKQGASPPQRTQWAYAFEQSCEQLCDERSPKPLRTAYRVTKMILKHYGSVRSLLQAHASPNTGRTLNCGIRFNIQLPPLLH
jgi:hypothetical protein